MTDDISLDVVRDAMQYVDLGCDRDTWHALGRGWIDAGGSVEEFDEMSSRASNYRGSADVRSAFRKIKPGGGTTAKTILKMAREAGWRPEDERRNGRAQPRKQAQQRPAPPNQGVDLARLAARFQPAPADFPYLVRKQVPADGLYLVPAGSGLRSKGLDLDGTLAVPSTDETGTVTAWQCITADGEKVTLAGSSFGSGAFAYGERKPGGLVYVCEGLGQAGACWRATGHASLCCFGWGRVRTVAAAVLRRDPSAQVVIVPDAAKEDAAEKIARELQCRYVPMPQGWPENSDVNDLALRDGFDALEALLAAPLTVQAAAPRFRLQTAEELDSHTPAPYLVKGIVPANSLGGIVGQPTTAKSLLGLHLLTALSEGRSFFGRRTRQVESLYVFLEGAAGMAKRVKAQRITGRDCSGLKFLGTSLDIRSDTDRAELIECVKKTFKPEVVLIDTLAQSMPGADENTSADMGAGIRGLQDFQRQLGVTVIAVHHLGKDAGKGPRGHSSLFAALDFAIEVRRDGDNREWQLTKAKDDEDGQIHPFTLRVVELGRDEDGDLITSAVVHEFTDEPAPARRVKPPTSGNQRLAWLAINDLLSESQQFGLGPAPIGRKCITLDAAIEGAGRRFAVDPKRRRERAVDTITRLAGRGCIVLKEDVIWLP